MKAIFLIVLTLLISSCLPMSIDEGDSIEPVDDAKQPAQNDAGTNSDLPANISSPFKIEYGATKGTLTSNDDGDAYGLSYNPGDSIEIRLVPSSEKLDVVLTAYFFDGSTDYFDTADSIVADDSLAGIGEAITFSADKSYDVKKFGVLVESRGATFGEYSLDVKAIAQNDAGSSGDAPFDIDNPVQVSDGSFEGFLSGGDKWDYYTLLLSANQTIEITVTPETTLDVKIAPGFYCSYGCIIDGSDSDNVNNGFKGEKETYSIQRDFEHIYKFGILKVDGRGNYRFAVKVTN